jgi:uncharacterized paraquat-inducible protein A
VQMQHFTAAPIMSLQCCSGVIAALPLPAMHAGQLLASAEVSRCAIRLTAHRPISLTAPVATAASTRRPIPA